MEAALIRKEVNQKENDMKRLPGYDNWKLAAPEDDANEGSENMDDIGEDSEICKTFEDVGKTAQLTEHTLQRYVSYMTVRWGASEARMVADGYAFEWAGRFKRGNEYSEADCVGQSLLDTMGHYNKEAF